METSDFPSLWRGFTEELEARNQVLQDELAAAWEQLDSLLGRHAEKIARAEGVRPPEGSLESIRELATTRAAPYLSDPLQALKRIHPQERALRALETFQTGLEDILGLLPQTLTVPRGELAAELCRDGRPLRRLALRLGRKPRVLQPRPVLRQALWAHSARRVEPDGDLLLLLARASLALLIPWQLLRNDTLRAMAGNPSDPRTLDKARAEWLEMVGSIRRDAARALEAQGDRCRRLRGELEAALLAGERRLADRRLGRAMNRWQRCFRYWASRQRAILAQLELEASSRGLLEGSVGVSEDAVRSVDEEHALLLGELDKVGRWLSGWREGETESPFPPPGAHLVSSADRASDWKRRLEAAGRGALPASIESVDLGRPLPGRRPRSRSVPAEARFTRSLAGTGRELALAGFGEAEEGHRAIIQQIERAREVAAYSLEAGREEGGSEEGRQVVRDGISNALKLLEHQRKSTRDHHPVIGRKLAEALSGVFFQFHIRMEESRLGLFRHLARQKSRQALRAGALTVMERVGSGSDWLGDHLALANQYVLAKLGWAPPSTIAVQPVSRRPYLGEVLHLKAGPRELPAIYRRLFRLAPLEDTRFLVGRETEMAAAAEARQRWEEGRAVAILVAGARGSGKTSFLNCARAGVFGDLPLSSGQFGERITTAPAMRAFLSALLGIEDAELESRLKSERRLVILEEVERTFIRRIGGFEGLRALLDLISTTCRNTLWILSLNESALGYLRQVVGMEEYFSHRINAMAVSPRHLKSAILQRHNLSGLRLHFAQPPPEESRRGRIGKLLGLRREPEQNYFDSLYRQSEGIFRSAFELWQESVDRVEGGVLYMRHPVEPSYEGIISRLTLEDSFILQAILQHGGLTPGEIARVFDYSERRSDSCIEKLISWEIIEPDPSNPGFRVCPEAGRLVRQALYRQNLL